jgi:hypothetical protein
VNKSRLTGLTKGPGAHGCLEVDHKNEHPGWNYQGIRAVDHMCQGDRSDNIVPNGYDENVYFRCPSGYDALAEYNQGIFLGVGVKMWMKVVR